MNRIKLGLGLIGIGRPWGQKNAAVPSEEEALDFLEYAYSLGFTYFDTAASYGFSEKRLGKFLKTINKSQRERRSVC